LDSPFSLGGLIKQIINTNISETSRGGLLLCQGPCSGTEEIEKAVSIYKASWREKWVVLPPSLLDPCWLSHHTLTHTQLVVDVATLG